MATLLGTYIIYRHSLAYSGGYVPLYDLKTINFVVSTRTGDISGSVSLLGSKMELLSTTGVVARMLKVKPAILHVRTLQL